MHLCSFLVLWMEALMLLEPMPVAIPAGSALPWRAAHCSLALARWCWVEHASDSWVAFLMDPFVISVGSSVLDCAGASASTSTCTRT